MIQGLNISFQFLNHFFVMGAIELPTLSLIIFGSLFASLQLWWISSLIRRNRRVQGERPLTATQFRQDLERIFKKSG